MCTEDFEDEYDEEDEYERYESYERMYAGDGYDVEGNKVIREYFDFDGCGTGEDDLIAAISYYDICKTDDSRYKSFEDYVERMCLSDDVYFIPEPVGEGCAYSEEAWDYMRALIEHAHDTDKEAADKVISELKEKFDNSMF